MTHLVARLSQNTSCGWGAWYHSLSFKTFFSFSNRLPVTITFSLSTFTFIKRLFSSSSLSAIRVVSSAYVRLYFFGLQITADGDSTHEIKRRLLLGRKVMTNLDSICKSRHITLPTKVRLVKSMVFPVVMYGCESWTVKKAERRMMLLNRGVGEDSWESLGLQGDPTSPFWRRSTLGFLWKDWC